MKPLGPWARAHVPWPNRQMRVFSLHCDSEKYTHRDMGMGCRGDRGVGEAWGEQINKNYVEIECDIKSEEQE